MEKSFEKRIEKPAAFLFYTGLFIEVAAVIIDKSSWTNPYQSLMFRIAFFFFCLCCLLRIRCFGMRELVFIVIFGALGVVSWRCSSRNELLRFLAFICACRTQDVRKAARFIFFTTIAGSLLLIVLALTNVMGSLYVTMDYGRGVETRWNLGFGHPNSLHCIMVMLLILGLYLYEKQMKFYIYVLLLVGNFLLYQFTRSNTACATGMAALILSLLLHYIKKLSDGNLIYLLGEVLLGVGLLFSILAGILDPAKYSFMDRLDGILNGRISSMWLSLFQEGTLGTWKWFGNRLNIYYFDLGWLRVVYWYGVIPALLVILIVYIMLEHARKTKDKAAYTMLICLCIYTVFEAHLVSEFAGRNYLFLIAALYLPEIINQRQKNRLDGEIL